MAGASEPGGQKSDQGWAHVPLAATDRPWCLEWPLALVNSARLCLVLTTEHPGLLASPAWAENLKRLLDAAARAASQGDDLTHAAWLHAALRLHADGERKAGQGDQVLARLLEAWQARMPTGLASQLRRAHPRGQGRRLAAGTLADHDAVERLRRTDPELDSADARIVSVAEQRTGGADTGYTDRTGPYAAVKKHHQRVKARAAPLPYLLLPCEQHAGVLLVAPVPIPHPAWQDLPPPDLDTLERARTITFRPRVALPAAEPPPLILREGMTWKSPR